MMPSRRRRIWSETHWGYFRRNLRPGGCVFREIWAPISRNLGHAFHAILGSHFADAGRLADGFMESGLMGSVKRFRSVGPASQAFSGEEEAMGIVNEPVENGVGQSWVADGLVPVIDGQLTGDDG